VLEHAPHAVTRRAWQAIMAVSALITVATLSSFHNTAAFLWSENSAAGAAAAAGGRGRRGVAAEAETAAGRGTRTRTRTAFVPPTLGGGNLPRVGVATSRSSVSPHSLSPACGSFSWIRDSSSSSGGGGAGGRSRRQHRGGDVSLGVGVGASAGAGANADRSPLSLPPLLLRKGRTPTAMGARAVG
ncbi:unnamed protein product, partial [Pylaiella littoralis]